MSDNVIIVSPTIVAIVVPAGTPVPVTRIPSISLLVFPKIVTLVPAVTSLATVSVSLGTSNNVLFITNELLVVSIRLTDSTISSLDSWLIFTYSKLTSVDRSVSVVIFVASLIVNDKFASFNAPPV